MQPFGLAAPVDPVWPINPQHRLNRGRTLWLLAGLGDRTATVWGGLTYPRRDGALSVTVGGFGPGARPGNPTCLGLDNNAPDRVDLAAASTLMGASSGACAIWFRALVAVSASVPYQMPTVLGDGFNNYIGLHYGQLLAGAVGLWAYIWDGTAKVVYSPIGFASWNRALMSYDGATLSLYLNGQPVGSVASGLPQVTANAWNVGDRFASGPHVVDQFDDVATWSRSLSAGEALEDYLESAAGYPSVLNRPTAAAPGLLAALAPPSGAGAGNPAALLMAM